MRLDHSNPTRQYHRLLADVLDYGLNKPDRTGTGTRSLFGYTLRFALSQGFPLITTKRLHVKSILGELLWFISGSTNVQDLRDMGVTIWDEWAPDHGHMGPIYGSQWRSWPKFMLGGIDFIDQLGRVIQQIQTNPHSRRHIVSAWNVGQLEDMALPPCHLLYQFYVQDGRLSCQMYQRSVDVFLGLPFNMASYAALTHMVAQVCGLEVGELVMCLGDTHLYQNHFTQAEEQLSRDPFKYEPPTLRLAPEVRDIDDFTLDDMKVVDYVAYPHIKAKVSV